MRAGGILQVSGVAHLCESSTSGADVDGRPFGDRGGKGEDQVGDGHVPFPCLAAGDARRAAWGDVDGGDGERLAKETEVYLVDRTAFGQATASVRDGVD